MAKSNAGRQKAYRKRNGVTVQGDSSMEWYKRSGFVYLIHATGTDYYKIGVTRSHPRVRLSALQTGCPYGLVLTTAVPVMNMEEVEATIHNWIEHVRVRGEWFSLDDSLLLELRDILRIEANYYESKLVWLHQHGACDIGQMVRMPYKEFNPYAIQTG